jgi:hypothetical protein
MGSGSQSAVAKNQHDTELFVFKIILYQLRSVHQPTGEPMYTQSFSVPDSGNSAHPAPAIKPVLSVQEQQSLAQAQARFDEVIDADGNIVVADVLNHCIRKVTPDGTVSTLAGSRKGKGGFADGPAADARFKQPASAAIDADGNIVVADWGNHLIRRIDPTGNVTTVAGKAGEVGSVDGVAGHGISRVSTARSANTTPAIL